MPNKNYTYIIVGGGLTGANAALGIRERDQRGSVLLIGHEKHRPYDRPPLTKKLWFGTKKVEDIFVLDEKVSDEKGIEVQSNTLVTAIDPAQKTVTDLSDNVYHYQKLLLATGGVPRILTIQGGSLKGLYYYRYLDDYLRLRQEAQEGKSALVIGGGFIGSEIAAALNINKLDVTMIFPSPYLVSRVFPDYLGMALQRRYQEKGVEILAGDALASISKQDGRFMTVTRNGKQIASDIVIVGIGIQPWVSLAQEAGLEIANGIIVNEYLQTSHPDIYAAGDLALFPYQALGKKMRVEHWDNAVTQGKWAGWNMAGAAEPYSHMPYFYSDLFEFGYEAVGDVDSQLETFADWKKENDTGVIYYLKDGKVRGAMMCNVWDKVPAARELIRKGERVTPEDLRGAIR